MDPKLPRTPAFPIDQLPGSLPNCTIDEHTDPAPIAQAALIHLQLLDSALLTEDAIWRDLCAFTGTLRTFYGSRPIQTVWKELVALFHPTDFTIVPGSVRIMRPSPKAQWIEARFEFRMLHGSLEMLCDGIMRLVQDAELSWRLWTLITALKDVEGWGEVDDLDPIVDDVDMVDAIGSLGNPMDGEAPQQLPTPASDDGIRHIPVVIVGAGFSGLCTAGRLQALGVPYVVLDKEDELGGNWTARYPSVRIHTSKEYGQFPFRIRIWGPETPYHLSPDDLERGFKKYASLYGINIQLKTKVERGFWDGKSSTWTLQLDYKGERDYLECKHLILALGPGGQVPKMPALPGRDKFKGTVLHTSAYTTSAAWTGLRGAVIGSANSAHDVCNDMLGAGLSSVTMVQRGRTPVLPVETYRAITDKIYNVATPVALSDLLSVSTPNAIGRRMALAGISAAAARDPDRFDALERAGFRVERNMDLYSSLYERFGGHYFDVGVSGKIARGLIAVKPAPPGRALCGFHEHGMLFEDGSSLDADVVVFATGFEGNMRKAAAEIVGDEVADSIEDWWGVDAEGEIRGGWKYIGHPGIWMTGGNFGLARYYSRFLALQIKADLEGVPFSRYEKRPG